MHFQDSGEQVLLHVSSGTFHWGQLELCHGFDFRVCGSSVSSASWS